MKAERVDHRRKPEAYNEAGDLNVLVYQDGAQFYCKDRSGEVHVYNFPEPVGMSIERAEAARKWFVALAFKLRFQIRWETV